MTVMLSRIVKLLLIAGLASSKLYASQSPDAAFMQSYRECVALVDSLRPDKPGQVRVFAADGSEFTAGQVRWMHAQLSLVNAAHARGDQVQAAQLLAGIHDLLEAHSRSSGARALARR
jgi:hypothetical protein